MTGQTKKRRSKKRVDPKREEQKAVVDLRRAVEREPFDALRIEEEMWRKYGYTGAIKGRALEELLKKRKGKGKEK